MRIVGSIKQREIVVLVDFKSTHNFLSQQVVEELSLPIDKSIPLQVGVASGMKMISVGKCSHIELQMQGHVFMPEFHVIHLIL